MGVAVSAESEEYLPKAVEIRDRLARAIWERRFDFQICGEYAPDIETAIKTAVDAAESSIFIGDAGDNVTAGAPGDNTLFLKPYLKQISQTRWCPVLLTRRTRRHVSSRFGRAGNPYCGGKA